MHVFQVNFLGVVLSGLLWACLMLTSIVSQAAYGKIDSVAQAPHSGDPWQKFNRGVFKFNEGVDHWTLKPLAKAYQRVVPTPVREGVGNLFDNLENPLIGVNDLLQLKLKASAQDFLRFGVNLTLGLLGCFDVASRMNIPQHDEDFGQTLGYWGVPSGPYVMLPFLGPSTLRDAFTRPLDLYLGPSRHIDHVPTRNTEFAVSLINTRTELFEYEALIVGDAYSFIRDAYLQRRDFQVKDGEVEDPFLDDDW